MAIPKFSSGGQGTFHAELKKRIQDHFTKSGKSTTGNFSLFFKGGLLFSLLVLIYVHLVFFTPVAWLAIAESALLGLVISAIGFNVMHDGAHGSFSKYKWVNRIAAYTLNLLGGNAFMWNMKHNIIHHSYTNIEGVDDDIEIQPWLRMSPAQKKYKMHKYQHRYFWFLYSLLYIFWVFLLDYTKYFRRRIGPTPLKKMSVTDHITFWSFKMLHYFIFIALPVIMLGWIPWLIGFLTCTLLAGFVLSIVFQLAHTVEDTEFPHAVEPTNRMPDEWAVHQIKTTANFATRNKVISWLVGGLNFQIEHHLFPKISHVHYPEISKILRQICREYNINYVEYPYMLQAVSSHVSYLKKMGNA